MNQRDIADGLGLTEGQVSKLVAQGMPTDSVEAALEWRRLHVRPWGRSTGGSVTDGQAEAAVAGSDNAGYWAAKARREASLADLAEIELAKARADLVVAAEVQRGLADASRMLRDMVLSVPNRIAAQVVACGDAGQAQQLMRAELRAALEQFDRLAHDAVARSGC